MIIIHYMLRIALQAKGRLYEDSLALLSEIGIKIDDAKRKFLSQSSNFPLEVLYLRDDDIPGIVASGTASLGIVGLNEVEEKGADVDIVCRTGFSKCRISIAVPKSSGYSGPAWLEGKRIATSYPGILRKYLEDKGINARIEVITGSVEIAPAADIADAIFDIVSSGSTLVSNGLVEVERVFESEAVVIARKGLPEDERKLLEEILFRIESVRISRDKRYVMMNIPASSLEKALEIIPSMKSPTVLPLADRQWCSLHSIVSADQLWEKVRQLKEVGAEGILVLNVDKIIL